MHNRGAGGICMANTFGGCAAQPRAGSQKCTLYKHRTVPAFDAERPRAAVCSSTVCSQPDEGAQAARSVDATKLQTHLKEKEKEGESA
jgi:hypothetical protein